MIRLQPQEAALDSSFFAKTKKPGTATTHTNNKPQFGDYLQSSAQKRSDRLPPKSDRLPPSNQQQSAKNNLPTASAAESAAEKAPIRDTKTELSANNKPEKARQNQPDTQNKAIFVEQNAVDSIQFFGYPALMSSLYGIPNNGVPNPFNSLVGQAMAADTALMGQGQWQAMSVQNNEMALGAQTTEALFMNQQVIEENLKASSIFQHPIINPKVHADQLSQTQAAHTEQQAVSDDLYASNNQKVDFANPFRENFLNSPQSNLDGDANFDQQNSQSQNFANHSQNANSAQLETYGDHQKILNSTAPSFNSLANQASPQANAPLFGSGLNEQSFLENAQQMKASGRERFSMQLRPEGLGRVDFLITKIQGNITAEIRLDDEQLAKDLGKNVKKLQATLESNGVKVDDFKIVAKSGDTTQNFAQLGKDAENFANNQQSGSQHFGQPSSGQTNKPNHNVGNNTIDLAFTNPQDQQNFASSRKDPNRLIDLNA